MDTQDIELKMVISLGLHYMAKQPHSCNEEYGLDTLPKEWLDFVKTISEYNKPLISGSFVYVADIKEI